MSELKKKKAKMLRELADLLGRYGSSLFVTATAKMNWLVDGEEGDIDLEWDQDTISLREAADELDPPPPEMICTKASDCSRGCYHKKEHPIGDWCKRPCHKEDEGCLGSTCVEVKKTSSEPS